MPCRLHSGHCEGPSEDIHNFLIGVCPRFRYIGPSELVNALQRPYINTIFLSYKIHTARLLEYLVLSTP